MKTIIVGADHAGFAVKEALLKHLGNLEYNLIDVGAHSDESVDYPTFASDLCKKLKAYNDAVGLLVCGSGVGMAIAANRFPHVRAVVGSSPALVEAARKHNDANVLCLGARFTETPEAIEILKTFLDTQFSGGHHENRVNMLSNPQI
jgi:ribose 5-phosphate isomerase B